MNEEKLYNMLVQLGYPVAYDHFTKKDVSIPFILYHLDSVNTFKADDYVYSKDNSYEVDLVTDKKDIEVEQRIEKLFDDNKIPYEKYEEYIDSENIYQIYYTI